MLILHTVFNWLSHNFVQESSNDQSFSTAIGDKTENIDEKQQDIELFKPLLVVIKNGRHRSDVPDSKHTKC